MSHPQNKIAKTLNSFEQWLDDRDAIPPSPRDVRELVAWCREKMHAPDMPTEFFISLVGSAMTAAHKLAQTRAQKPPTDEQIAQIAIGIARSTMLIMMTPIAPSAPTTNADAKQ